MGFNTALPGTNAIIFSFPVFVSQGLGEGYQDKPDSC
jgi:hypothetical protein